ncbi:unnamed protein product [Moneuplotes crassus]|uniref:Uncharacterized protein n=1 Tax=Euplotes crassus TaxID=5936 RepID=A0AAD1X5S2_EUPCR|nr:unnamed protein product [Moneuplotes crassus]
MLMSQLNTVIDPCNAPIRRKKSIYSKNANDEENSFNQLKVSPNGFKSRNLSTMHTGVDQSRTLVGKNSKLLKNATIDIRVNGNNNLNSSIQLSENHGETTTNSQLMGGFEETLNYNLNPSCLLPKKGKKRRLLGHPSKSFKFKKKSTLTKKQIIKKSISLMKMGFLKKFREKISEEEKTLDLQKMINSTKEKSLPSLNPKVTEKSKLEPISLVKKASGSDRNSGKGHDISTSLRQSNDLSLNSSLKKKHKKANLKVLARKTKNDVNRSHTGSTGKSTKVFKVGE